MGQKDEVFFQIWEIDIPPKSKHLIWRVMLDRMPSRENLRKRNVNLDDDLCPFCTQREETISHVILSCKEIDVVWKQCFEWLNVLLAMYNEPRAYFLHNPDSLV